jgi:hypothetical protein
VQCPARNQGHQAGEHQRSGQDDSPHETNVHELTLNGSEIFLLSGSLSSLSAVRRAPKAGT